jgi:molecular chaperone GrpE
VTENHGKTVRIEVNRESGRRSDKDLDGLQPHAPSQPVPLAKDKATGAAKKHEAEGEHKSLKELREFVEANRATIKRSEEIISRIDGLLKGKPPKDETSAAELLGHWVQAEKESSENRDRWIRSAADLDNYKKRAAQERSRLLKYQYEDLLRSLLPLIDNLERALNHARAGGEDNSLVEGVSLIAGMFKDVLEKFGVREIKAVDEPFNPEIHEAVARTSAPSRQANMVIEELEKGYMYHDRLLRPARVVVAAGDQ